MPRIFQTIQQQARFRRLRHCAAGFACDEGVKRNHGRPGAAQAPDVLRKALANMASHQGMSGWRIWARLGRRRWAGGAQQALSDAVTACQRSGMRTLVFGGGHETAWAHGAACWMPSRTSVWPLLTSMPISICARPSATSGTPFRQLAHYCAEQRAFQYACFGVSRAANTQALWDEAERLNVTLVEDLHFRRDALSALEEVLAQADRVYLTIDLDVLPAGEMPAVSAPAALAYRRWMLSVIERICRSGKLQAADLVSLTRSTIGTVRAQSLPPVWPGKLLTGGHNTIQGVTMFSRSPRRALRAFYEKVKQAISEKIASGVWRPHDRIPSEAELVAQFGFSRMTINRALRELTDEGFWCACRGRDVCGGAERAVGPV
jgi:formiminoglutamase